MQIELKEYKNNGGISVLGLIEALERIVDDNPHLNFGNMGVSLNSGEYEATKVTLSYWKAGEELRAGLDID